MLVRVPAEASATQAMERLRDGFIEGCQFVCGVRIRGFFGEIGHDRLLAVVAAGVGPAGAQAGPQWLEAGVMVDGEP